MKIIIEYKDTRKKNIQYNIFIVQQFRLRIKYRDGDGLPEILCGRQVYKRSQNKSYDKLT